MNELMTEIDSWVSAVNTKLEALHNKDYKNIKYEPVAIIGNGADWIKIGKGGSVYAFIRVSEKSTNSMGHMVPGNIYKPASFKAPAAHKRGNVFEPNATDCAGQYGIAYLR